MRKYFEYILLVVCWVFCIAGVKVSYYSADIIPLASMMLIVGSIIMKEKI